MSYQAISSNTLFHFTSKREYLINILKNNFRPRYCLENFACLTPNNPTADQFTYAFPMTCFCDLTLSNTGKHLHTYGNYGIGLTKDWGKRNGLNPILYVHANSVLWKDIHESSLVIQEQIRQNILFDDDLIKGITRLKFFIKPYEDDYLRNGEIIPNVRFYDEREWRFVPTSPDNEFYFMEKQDFINSAKREEWNNKLPESATLEFTPDDIRYIVVEREDEISKMVDEIMHIKGDKYTCNQLKILTTRIISAEQIREDF